MEKAKRVVWRLLAASVCVMAVSQAVHADSLDEQRNRYAQIKQAWDNKQMDTVQALMPTLKDYPLYPYLEYRQITDDLMNQPTVTVNNFIQANPTLPPARFGAPARLQPDQCRRWPPADCRARLGCGGHV